MSPKDIWVVCDQVVPLGLQVIRQANSSECFVARSAYMFSFQGVLYGSFSFNTLQEFIDYRNTNCTILECCTVLVNGCMLSYNGKLVKYALRS